MNEPASAPPADTVVIESEYHGFTIERFARWPESWQVIDPDGYQISEGHDSLRSAYIAVDAEIERRLERLYLESAPKTVDTPSAPG
jgi:hypothetical protein